MRGSNVRVPVCCWPQASFPMLLGEPGKGALNFGPVPIQHGLVQRMSVAVSRTDVSYLDTWENFIASQLPRVIIIVWLVIL